jgi:hypothetical protein
MILADEWTFGKPKTRKCVLRHHGQTAEATVFLLDYGDYPQFLRILARHADWESLPPYLQDAADNLLADDALAEEGPAVPLLEALTQSGDAPR